MNEPIFLHDLSDVDLMTGRGPQIDVDEESWPQATGETNLFLAYAATPWQDDDDDRRAPAATRLREAAGRVGGGIRRSVAAARGLAGGIRPGRRIALNRRATAGMCAKRAQACAALAVVTIALITTVVTTGGEPTEHPAPARVARVASEAADPTSVARAAAEAPDPARVRAIPTEPAELPVPVRSETRERRARLRAVASRRRAPARPRRPASGGRRPARRTAEPTPQPPEPPAQAPPAPPAAPPAAAPSGGGDEFGFEQ